MNKNIENKKSDILFIVDITKYPVNKPQLPSVSKNNDENNKNINENNSNYDKINPHPPLSRNILGCNTKDPFILGADKDIPHWRRNIYPDRINKKKKPINIESKDQIRSISPIVVNKNNENVKEEEEKKEKNKGDNVEFDSKISVVLSSRVDEEDYDYSIFSKRRRSNNDEDFLTVKSIHPEKKQYRRSSTKYNNNNNYIYVNSDYIAMPSISKSVLDPHNRIAYQPFLSQRNVHTPSQYIDKKLLRPYDLDDIRNEISGRNNEINDNIEFDNNNSEINNIENIKNDENNNEMINKESTEENIEENVSKSQKIASESYEKSNINEMETLPTQDEKNIIDEESENVDDLYNIDMDEINKIVNKFEEQYHPDKYLEDENELLFSTARQDTFYDGYNKDIFLDNDETEESPRRGSVFDDNSEYAQIYKTTPVNTDQKRISMDLKNAYNKYVINEKDKSENFLKTNVSLKDQRVKMKELDKKKEELQNLADDMYNYSKSIDSLYNTYDTSIYINTTNKPLTDTDDNNNEDEDILKETLSSNREFYEKKVKTRKKNIILNLEDVNSISPISDYFENETPTPKSRDSYYVAEQVKFPKIKKSPQKNIENEMNNDNSVVDNQSNDNQVVTDEKLKKVKNKKREKKHKVVKPKMTEEEKQAQEIIQKKLENMKKITEEIEQEEKKIQKIEKKVQPVKHRHIKVKYLSGNDRVKQEIERKLKLLSQIKPPPKAKTPKFKFMKGKKEKNEHLNDTVKSEEIKEYIIEKDEIIEDKKEKGDYLKRKKEELKTPVKKERKKTEDKEDKPKRMKKAKIIQAVKHVVFAKRVSKILYKKIKKDNIELSPKTPKTPRKSIRKSKIRSESSIDLNYIQTLENLAFMQNNVDLLANLFGDGKEEKYKLLPEIEWKGGAHCEYLIENVISWINPPDVIPEIMSAKHYKMAMKNFTIAILNHNIQQQLIWSTALQGYRYDKDWEGYLLRSQTYLKSGHYEQALLDCCLSLQCTDDDSNQAEIFVIRSKVLEAMGYIEMSKEDAMKVYNYI